MDNKVIQSYVWHEGKCFFVSTIDRESSSALAYGGRYAETLVWEYNYESREVGSIVGQSEWAENSIRSHIVMCERLHKFGCCDEPDND